MANVLSMERKILIEQLLSLGWSYRRIERETGIRRETISRHYPKHPRNDGDAKPAKVPTEAGADIPQKRPKCPPTPGEDSGDLPPPVRPTRRSNAAPFDAVIREKLGAGLSAQRIYQDLVVGHGYEGSYDSVKRYARKLRAKAPELVGRVHVAPGDEGQVDFGVGAPTWKDGRYRKPWLFKMVLSHSRHSYEEVVWRQDVETFIRCHERAFEAFGGVPRLVRVDNLKSAVLRAHLYEPVLNPNYAAFGRHAGFFPWPCLPAKPEHKGKVESGIGYTQDNALKGLRFDAIEAQNAHLRHWNRTWARTRIHGTTKKQVWAVFTEREQPALQPLPESTFELFKIGRRIVQPDGYVEVGCAYYPAPHDVLGQEVTVHHNQNWVKILRGEEVLAFHRRAERGTFVSGTGFHPAHKTRSHADYEEHLLDTCRRVGPSTVAWAEAMLQLRGPVAQRSIRGLLTLERRHSAADIETACRQSLEEGAVSYRTVEELCRQDTAPARPALTNDHPLIRPLAAYQSYLNLIASSR